MLHRDPARRLTIRDVLNHKWLRRVEAGGAVSYDLGGGSAAAAPAVDVARIKTAVENTFTAFQQPPTVMLAPIGK